MCVCVCVCTVCVCVHRHMHLHRIIEARHVCMLEGRGLTEWGREIAPQGWHACVRVFCTCMRRIEARYGIMGVRCRTDVVPTKLRLEVCTCACMRACISMRAVHVYACVYMRAVHVYVASQMYACGCMRAVHVYACSTCVCVRVYACSTCVCVRVSACSTCVCCLSD